MDKKLEDYRKKKRRQATLNSFKEKLFNMVSFHQVQHNADGTKSSHVIVDGDFQIDNVSFTISLALGAFLMKDYMTKSDQYFNVFQSNGIRSGSSNDDDTYSDTDSLLSSSTLLDEDEDDPDDRVPKSKYFTYFTYIVYFLFWATCYAIAIQLKFGTVYFLFSGLLGIYLNTRTGPKAAGEPSAYSVFNENCEAIEGSLKAEQFEREIRYGAVGMGMH